MEIRELKKEEYIEFKEGIQEAFQNGFEAYFGKSDELVIPDKDILESYEAKGSKSYVCIEDGKIIGGCVVVIDEETQINGLHILYVKVGVQSKGVGYFIWDSIEKMYPDTIKWTTCTPYFDRRNIHFYVNKCKFHIVEYVFESNPDFIGDHGEGMFEFEKIMK